MQTITIRPHTEADWTRISEIHDSARKLELHNAGLDGAFLPLSTAAPAEGLFDYTVVVAIQEGGVCGFAAYTDEELAWLYVDPDCMRRGIGSALVRHVIEHTHKRPLCIEVLKGNTPAIRLYESMGFHTMELCSGKMPGNECFSVTVHCMQLE